MMDLAAAREQWVAERPKYAALAAYVENILKEHTRQHGIVSKVDSREKDIASFVKKIMKKKYERPFEQMTDKAGARVVVTYAEQVGAVCGIIEQMFDIRCREDKADALGVDRLGYLGKHYLVSLRPEQLQNGHEELEGLLCEIQVNTQAERLWADLSHDLSYKPTQGGIGRAERVINRLVALIEIFDDEATRAKAVIENQPGFREAAILANLEQVFFRLAGRRFDRELSLDIIGYLLPTLEADEVDRLFPIMEGFVAGNAEKLEQIFSAYEADDRCSPLLFQPESLLIFQRLESDRYVLKHHWCQSLPLPMLEELALVWGITV